MESQILELRNDLKDKSVREQDANETIRIQAQALMKEKQQHEVLRPVTCLSVKVRDVLRDCTAFTVPWLASTDPLMHSCTSPFFPILSRSLVKNTSISSFVGN